MFIFYLLVSIILIILFFSESFLLRFSLNKIPVRILVNGTRGKSTTVRILYEILKNSGYKTFAKSTGDVPQIYYPDGSVKKQKRIAPASIIENRRILWAWAKHQPDAVILECMALQPETQRTLAQQIFRPTITVITNILADHQEVMGLSMAEIGRSIVECVYKKSELFVVDTNNAYTHLQEISCTQLHALKNTPCPFQLSNIPQSVLDESWTLVSNVSARLKINPKNVLLHFQGIWKKIDAQFEQKSGSGYLHFYNLFSTNDAQSAKLFIDHFLQQKKESAQVIFYLNCRADRPLRTAAFAELLSENYSDSAIWLTGGGWQQARRLIRKKMPEKQLTKNTAKSALKTIQSLSDKETVIFAIGNHKGSESFLEGIEQFLNGKQE